MFRLPYCFGVIIGLLLLGMRGTGKIPVYILYFKLYDIIILLNSVFHTAAVAKCTCRWQCFPNCCTAQQVNVTTEQHDGSNRLNSLNAPEINKSREQ